MTRLCVDAEIVDVLTVFQVNQSYNQSHFYNANIPDEARLTATTAESVFNSISLESVKSTLHPVC